MKIGIISDTHSFLDPSVFDYFKEVDEIWHAGDIGDENILNQLEAFKPVRAVFGNIDGHKIRASSPEDQLFTLGGYRVLITHIAGKPPRYNARVKHLIKSFQPHMLVCGHSHMLKVEFDTPNKLLFVNPGAAGRHGFHKIRTLIRFEISDKKPRNMEVIELGKRSAIK